MATIRSLIDGGRFREALAEAEDRVPVYVFWLDIQHASAQALAGLGLKECAGALLAAVGSLLAEVPVIADLAFDDGTPFASGETRDWLAAREGGGGRGEAETALYDRYLEGDAAKSLSELGAPASRPRTGRERLLARSAEMRLYQRSGRPAEAAVLARRAVVEVERLELTSYDPEAAGRAMSAAAFVLRGAGPGFRPDYFKALGLLAECGPRAVSDLPPGDLE
jgi:type VI secretion system protein VasJ